MPNRVPISRRRKSKRKSNWGTDSNVTHDHNDLSQTSHRENEPVLNSSFTVSQPANPSSREACIPHRLRNVPKTDRKEGESNNKARTIASTPQNTGSTVLTQEEPSPARQTNGIARSWASVVAGAVPRKLTQDLKSTTSVRGKCDSLSGSQSVQQTSPVEQPKTVAAHEPSHSTETQSEQRSTTTGHQQPQMSESSPCHKNNASLENNKKRHRRGRGKAKAWQMNGSFKTGQHQKDWKSLLRLPNETLLKILAYTLDHDGVISVSPTFAPISGNNEKSPLNYSILHTCVRLYELGLPLYYSLNTWAIDIGKFTESPEMMRSWPDKLGFSYAVEYVRSIIIMASHTSDYSDCVHLLKGFRNLESVVFDMRNGHPGREFVIDAEKFPFVEIEVSSKVKATLEKAQVKIVKTQAEGHKLVSYPGKIMVGHETKEKANEEMDSTLDRALRSGMIYWIRHRQGQTRSS